MAPRIMSTASCLSLARMNHAKSEATNSEAHELTRKSRSQELQEFRSCRMRRRLSGLWVVINPNQTVSVIGDEQTATWGYWFRDLWRVACESLCWLRESRTSRRLRYQSRFPQVRRRNIRCSNV